MPQFNAHPLIFQRIKPNFGVEGALLRGARFNSFEGVVHHHTIVLGDFPAKQKLLLEIQR